jgi:hypothetical protein
MTSKMATSIPFFFIFDFYLMQGASEDNDVLPQAILYFYPIDEQIKKEVIILNSTKIDFSFIEI